MATFNKLTLSSSTDGRGIKIGATASPGTTIHVASTTATHYDEIWLYAQNSDANAKKLTVQWGATTSPDDLIEITIPGESGLVLVTPGLLLKGNSTALTVRAFAETTNVVMIHGYVNRIS